MLIEELHKDYMEARVRIDRANNAKALDLYQEIIPKIKEAIKQSYLNYCSSLINEGYTVTELVCKCLTNDGFIVSPGFHRLDCKLYISGWDNLDRFNVYNTEEKTIKA